MTMRNALFACFVFLIALQADARELHWRALTVRAELQNDGALRVSERHTMVFTGDWNGGERSFRVERHHILTIHGMTRTTADGSTFRLDDAEIGTVDHYQLMGENVLRWRSRAPSDPEFNRTEIVYTIDYSLQRVLVPSTIPGSNAFALKHDFAFPHRPGNIKKFSLTLDLASDWSSPMGRHIQRHASQLVPGEGFPLQIPLEFQGTNAPASEGYVRMLSNRFRPAILPVVLMLPFFVFISREWRSRMGIAIDEGPIDEAWLQRNLLWHAPEVAGVFLHGDVGPPEVSALLARMEQERKISTEVKGGKRGKPNLHLELLVPLQQLEGAEYLIAQKIFRQREKTNTEELRQVYRASGFDPPAAIRNSVMTKAMVIAPLETKKKRILPGVVLMVAGLIGVIIAGIQEPASLVVMFVILFGGAGLAILGMPAALQWRKTRSVGSLVRIALVPVVAVAMASFIQRVLVPVDAASGQFTLLALLALATSWLGLYLMILAEAGEALAPETAAIRKTLSRARAFFRDELKKEKPAIRDQWTPWLMALGLDRSIATWWRSHGGEATGGTISPSSSSSSASWSGSGSATSTSAPSTFTGSGGAFGGAGASGSWGVAAMALATPVSAPATSGGSGGGSGSSSSSSSSSSSGSSSGGGGGGGW